MAYEVTKLVNGRPYRYRVHSERDPETGKTRNRWTYLGRGDGGKPAAATARRRPNAREALLDALERLLDRSDLGDVTAAAVSIEAGLAHGTFYRYFKNRVDAIHALKERLRTTAMVGLNLFQEPPASAAAARDAFREYVFLMMRVRSEHPGLVRALYGLVTQDAQARASLRDGRDANARRLADWLEAAATRGFLTLPPAGGLMTANMIFLMLDGIGRDSLTGGDALDETRIATAVELVERAVFGARA